MNFFNFLFTEDAFAVKLNQIKISSFVKKSPQLEVEKKFFFRLRVANYKRKDDK